MKSTALLALLSAFFFASCTSSLEQIVESKHQARVEAAYAGKPLTQGAGDGLGSYIAGSVVPNTPEK